MNQLFSSLPSLPTSLPWSNTTTPALTPYQKISKSFQGELPCSDVIYMMIKLANIYKMYQVYQQEKEEKEGANPSKLHGFRIAIYEETAQVSIQPPGFLQQFSRTVCRNGRDELLLIRIHLILALKLFPPTFAAKNATLFLYAKKGLEILQESYARENLNNQKSEEYTYTSNLKDASQSPSDQKKEEIKMELDRAKPNSTSRALETEINLLHLALEAIKSKETQIFEEECKKVNYQTLTKEQRLELEAKKSKETKAFEEELKKVNDLTLIASNPEINQKIQDLIIQKIKPFWTPIMLSVTTLLKTEPQLGINPFKAIESLINRSPPHYLKLKTEIINEIDIWLPQIIEIQKKS